jgi:mannose-6-phosphate isomerase-like protein (cupin superfamily)
MAGNGPEAPAATREDDQERLAAGPDRWFKVLIDPRFGSARITQFVGFIEHGRAPAHTHTYEEVIYILGGTGLVHVDERRVPISSGTSIFLPPGVPHCLENTGDAALKLLGVFSPPGSPAGTREHAPR